MTFVAPGAIQCDVCTGELFIGGQTMHTPAWCCVDLTSLWYPMALRGENVIIPGAVGRRAYPRRIDEVSVSLPFLINGVTDENGTPNADPNVGLQINMKTLYDNVVSPPALPASTRAATIDLPDGNTVGADIQVLALEVGERQLWQVRATLEILIPAGVFA